MNKYQYIKPLAEEFVGLLCGCILDVSGDSSREGYPEGGEFDW